MDKEEETQWLSVIAKSVAILALYKSDLGNGEVMAKAEFLEALGLSRNEVAQMLGTTANSLRVMSARKKKGGKRGKSKKGRS